MVNLTINGIPTSVKEGTTILEACRELGIRIPTLCFLKEINEVAACRVCVVEIEGVDKLRASCNTYCEEGMVVHTHSKKVIHARRTNVELILADHNINCTSCVRNGHCDLQNVCRDLNIIHEPYTKNIRKKTWDESLSLQKDASKCILCMRCINVCEKVQSLNVWDIHGTGISTTIDLKNRDGFSNAHCALCGQCVTHCPVSALSARDDSGQVFNEIYDPNKVVIFQIAPAVKASWSETTRLPKERANDKLLVAAIKSIGVDYVFDTTFTADLTIMEEGSELVEKIKEKKVGPGNLPLFTSCCPGWVRFLKMEYPDLVKNLSTAKSPQQMFGSITKTYIANKLNIPKENVVCVSVMPCIAKKYEADVEELNSSGVKDVDYVLTTRSLNRILRRVNVEYLHEQDFDSPLNIGTGAGIIFGSTGGVMEAALRSAHYLITGKNPSADAFKEIRTVNTSYDNLCNNSTYSEKTFKINDLELSICAVSGLKNARKLIEDILAGRKHYDFVEVMACPGGCAGGGGQPIPHDKERTQTRREKLYELDKNAPIRFSHENPMITTIYKEFLDHPLSELSEKLLHTDQTKWSL